MAFNGVLVGELGLGGIDTAVACIISTGLSKWKLQRYVARGVDKDTAPEYH